MIDTVSAFALATKSRALLASSSRAPGWAPTGIRRVTRRVRAFTTATAWSFEHETNTVSPPEAGTTGTSYGYT